MSASNYPEHKKMQAVRSESETLSSFVDWLSERGIALCKWQAAIRHSDAWGDFSPEGYYRVREGPNELFASFFEIDLEKVEEEKLEMISAMRTP